MPEYPAYGAGGGGGGGGAVNSVSPGSANLVISPTTGTVVADLSATAKADLALAATALQAGLTSFNTRATPAATLQAGDLTALMTQIASTTTPLLTVAGSTLAPTLTITSAVALVVENTDTVTLTVGGTQAIPDVTADTIHAYTFGAGNTTFTFPAAAAGKSFLIALKQDAVGSRTATFPSSATCRFPGATPPTLTTTPAKTDYLSFACTDGTHFDLVGLSQNI